MNYSPTDRAEVALRTDQGQVLKFSVQYVAHLDDWKPIVRYDMAHGHPHRDVLHPDGSHDTKSLAGYTPDEAFEIALRDFERNWQGYRERYERERP